MSVFIKIEGNLIADPQPGQGPDGAPVANFTVACNSQKKQADGSWQEVGSQLFSVAAWRGLAAAALNNLRKGTPVVVSGRLSFRSFTTKDGRDVTALEIDADDIGYSLRFHDVQGGKRQQGGGGYSQQGSAASYYGQPQQQPQQQSPQGYAQQPQQQWGQQQPAAQQAWGQPAVPPQQQQQDPWTQQGAAADAAGDPWGQTF